MEIAKGNNGCTVWCWVLVSTVAVSMNSEWIWKNEAKCKVILSLSVPASRGISVVLIGPCLVPQGCFVVKSSKTVSHHSLPPLSCDLFCTKKSDVCSSMLLPSQGISQVVFYPILDLESSTLFYINLCSYSYPVSDICFINRKTTKVNTNMQRGKSSVLPE